MKPAVLVLGATGTVGRGVVRAAAEAGWPVVAVARDAEALQALSRQYPRANLQVLVGSVTDDAAADALVTALQKLDRPFAGVIAALGAGEERGRLLDQPADQLRHAFDDAVMPQLVAARHLLPWLAASGRNCGYVMIGGPGGRNPWAGYGHRSISAAAVRMLARVLHGEARAFAVRLQLLEVESPVRTDDNEKHACKQWPCVDHIGRKALALLAHRNDARCTEAVVDYRNEACVNGDLSGSGRVGPHDIELDCDEPGVDSDVETTLPGSSHLQMTDSEPQEMDSTASLLPSRCLQDARKLLETFSPTRKNQERSR
ncbi:SDR family NAD(P)-dependent oxidoreductase [Lysobacter niabensis]|uniref:SDR family NAD(P)-dependent oxidoreductase n=1 Tax=Agrilutibacter niabensis TaxID=380628 RepID=UPI00360949DA